MKKLLLSYFILFVVIAFTACKKKDTAPANSAIVMFVDGCAGTTTVDVSVNSTKVGAATNLAFLKSSGYQYIAAGTDSISFILSNLGTPLINGKYTFVANARYSVFAGGLITGSSLVVTSDDLTAPATGNAKIRFVNLSTDALSETVNVGSNVIATGIAAQGVTAYSQVMAGSYTIKAGDPSNISTVVSIGPQQLDAGKIYTVMLTGTLPGTGTSGLTLTIINNN